MVGTSASISESFQVAAKRVVLESQQAMAAAIKEERFEDALEYAEKVLAVDPNNVMGQKFAALLQEKVDLDELVVVGEGEDDGAEEEGDGEEEGSDEEDSDEEDSEDEIYDDEEQGTEAPQAAAAAANGDKPEVEGQQEEEEDDDDDDDEEEEEDVDAIVSMPAKSLNMTSAQRRQMKEALAKQVYELKIEQEMGAKCSLLGI